MLWIAVPIWTALLLFVGSASRALATSFAVAALCVVANYVALAYGRIGLPLATPLCGIALAYLLWSWRRLNALLVFFRQRADALNAVPAGAFETPTQVRPLALDSVERRTHALDRAIDRLTRLQSLLTEGLWQLPVAVLICRADGVVSQSNAAARSLLELAGPQSEPTGAVRAAGDADPLRGIHLPKALAAMRRDDLPGPAPVPASGLWAGAMKSEFMTRQGKVFRLRAALLGALDDPAHGWIVVLPDVTAERRAQREREQWFGFLSHDLRSPQVSILNLLTLYAEGAPGFDIDRVMQGVESEAKRTIEPGSRLHGDGGGRVRCLSVHEQ